MWEIQIAAKFNENENHFLQIGVYVQVKIVNQMKNEKVRMP